MIYGLLFYEFFVIGLVAVGGGLATVPFLFTLSDRHGWFSHYDIVNMVAVSEAAPGPIGVKMAAYAGYRAAGFGGAFAATAGLIVPGILMMLLVVRVLATIRQNRRVDGAFAGMRPAACALMVFAAWIIAREPFALRFDLSAAPVALEGVVLRLLPVLLGAVLLVALRLCKKITPPMIILAAAAAGVVLGL